MDNNQSMNWNDLTSEEIRVVEYLKEEWEKQYRVTNIKQGIEALGLTYNNVMRMRVGDFLQLIYAGNKVFSKRLEKWGPYTFILTNEEKLIARYLLLNFKRSGAMPMSTEIAQTLNVEEKEVDASLGVLDQVGFIEKHKSGSPLGYSLSRSYEKFLYGLGLTFHEIRLENEETFNVQCSADALILALSAYDDQDMYIKDSCFHCLERIQLIFKKGKVISLNPKGIRLFEGTDCGSTNFFSSEEHFQEWITNLSATEVQNLCDPGKKKSISIKQFKIGEGSG